MPYAANNTISTDPISGGIEITDAQYAQALTEILAGKLVSIDSGFALVDPPKPADPPPPPPPPPVTTMSTLTYFERFTDAEYAAVRQGPIALQRGLDSMIAAQYVDVTDPRVTTYLSTLVTAGIITEARKTELLAPPL